MIVLLLFVHSFYFILPDLYLVTIIITKIHVELYNLDESNLISASNEIVFINFYADWCRFSNMLMPIFDDAADEVTKSGYESGKVVMGKVDCDKEAAIATRFHITKYPTLKLFRNGLSAKKEYRGMLLRYSFTSSSNTFEINM